MIGSVFQYGYALGVMNQLIDDLEQVFINRGTSVAMTFTTGKLLYMIEILRFLLSLLVSLLTKVLPDEFF